MRNALIAFGLLGWFALVVFASLCRCWCVVVPLLALGGMVETFAHEAIGARLDAAFAVQVEPDPCGWHAIVLDASDAVVFITDSYVALEDATGAAWDWINGASRRNGKTSSAGRDGR